MKITYDKSVDIAYIYLNSTEQKVNSSNSFAIDDILPFGDINIDFDDNNLIIGLEILNASKYLTKKILTQNNPK
jgi:uncharacterized protein YuzE